MTMGPERWREVEAIYHAALELPEVERGRFVREACRGDRELLEEVESLLGFDSAGAKLMEQPAAQGIGTHTALSSGRRLGAYEILDLVGAGGMGEVYRARDTRLGRTVALKVLPGDLMQSPERRERFEREARAVSRLSHPHICTLYDVGREDDTDFLVMEYLEGEPLVQRLSAGALPLEAALSYAVQVAGALAAAHRQGVVHRDLKPANVVLTGSGAKLLDFGLAKLISPTGADDAAPERAGETLVPVDSTRPGLLLGTPHYMSPEQAQGGAIDARSDVFSLGALLFEMLAGRRPFEGGSTAATLASLLRDDPPRVDELRPEVPKDLADVVATCLARDRELRYRSGAELLEALVACQAQLDARSRRPAAGRRWVPAAGVVALALLGLAGQQSLRLWRERQARRETLPEIERLAKADDVYHAFALARRVAPLLEGDPGFDHLWDTTSVVADIQTEPPGAEVAIKPYLEPEAPWESLGRSPVAGVRLPYAYLRWQISKPGYQTVEGAHVPEMLPVFVLTPLESAPEGMVRVSGGPFSFNNVRPVTLTDFWLDRDEVTNRQFEAFVDRGGYRTRAFWKVPFVDAEGRTLSWERAMERFRDATGRPGPAGWELGTYPDGQQDYPVAGVSWFEAAAYAEFAGKSLPTFFHWYRAAELGIVSDILLLSNFGEAGPAPVGSYRGLGPWGAHDQAGNVREWCWNATATGAHRFTLGGAWNDPTYLYQGPEAMSPWDRSEKSGFRCARYPTPPSPDTLAPVALGTTRDYDRETPVADEVFAAYRSLYAYDRTPLDARVEHTDDSSPHWRRETVSFAAAYGGERVIAQLYLPSEKAPPYPVVVYSPAASALALRSSEHVGFPDFTFLVRSGRAVLLPVVKGTYERRLPSSAGPNVYRDLRIQQFKDLARSLDWVETRPDLRADRIGYYGLSMGAHAGIVNAALEPRLRAIVLVSGGLLTGPVPGEIDPFNFARRVEAPVLLVAGRDDFRRPLKESQEPLMRLLGSREKRHYVFEGGHVPPRWQEVIRETLDWFDRYLGPA